MLKIVIDLLLSFVIDSIANVLQERYNSKILSL